MISRQSMTSLSLMLLFLCLSLHACTARSLTLTKRDTPNYPFDKDSDKAKLVETLSVKNYKLVENKLQQQKVENIEIREASGTSFHVDSPYFLAGAKGQRRHVRSMLGPDQIQHHVQETLVSNASDTAEDIVEMDYAQPHRKPPIHNEKP